MSQQRGFRALVLNSADTDAGWASRRLVLPVAAVAVGLLAVSIVVAAVGLPSGASQHRQPSEEDVTAAVQVTSNPNPVRAHSSPQIAVNPTNGELVVAETNVMGAKGEPRACNVHLSIDEGRSWAPGGDLMMEPYTECSRVVINGPYQTLEFADDGTLYLAFAASDPKWANPHPAQIIPRHIFLARSDDGGRSFQTTRVYAADPDEPTDDPHSFPRTADNGRPMVAVDNDESNRVYVSWYQRGYVEDEERRGVMAVSDDGGQSFSDPIELTDQVEGGSQPRPAVGADGTVHVLINGEESIAHRRSTDHGQTWSDSEEIYAVEGDNRKWILTADPNDPDRLYAAWDGSRDVDWAQEGDYRDVYAHITRDGGQTWDGPTEVHANPGDDSIHRYHPGIDVAPNGRLDVVWHDFRNSPTPERDAEAHEGYFSAGGQQDVYYSSLAPEDDAFGVDVRVTDRIIDREYGVWSNNVHTYTNLGIASTDDRVYAVWQDSREGDEDTDAEDVYFASIRLDDWQQQPVAAGGTDGGISSSPGLWALLVVTFLFGMGVAMLVAVPVRRRFGSAP